MVSGLIIQTRTTITLSKKTSTSQLYDAQWTEN